MVSYFSGCSTPEEIKQRYRSLAMEHHPDRGGTNETMAEINNQYGQLTGKSSPKDNYNYASAGIDINIDELFRDYRIRKTIQEVLQVFLFFAFIYLIYLLIARSKK